MNTPLLASMVDDVRDRFNNSFPRIVSVVVGLGFTGVKLENGSTGVAFTVTSQGKWHSCTFFQKAGFLEEQMVDQLLALALVGSARPEDRTLGIATLSALTSSLVQQRKVRISQRDTLEYLDLQKNDRVAMVGNIGPVIPQVLRQVSALTVIDNNPHLSVNNKPFDLKRDPEVIRYANKVILTGSSLVYDTMDDLLTLASNAERIIILGPSATLPPDPLKPYGVVALGGILIDDTDFVLKIIAQGGGTHALMLGSKKITILPS